MAYFDYNATHPIRHEVADSCADWLKVWANPSSKHQAGNSARGLLEDARESFAAALGCSHRQIVFTSGGTESNHLLVRGFVKENLLPGAKIISSKAEHSSVLSALELLRKDGYLIDYLALDREGMLDMEELDRKVKGAGLVSLMLANNETGHLLDIDKVSEICRKHGARLHVDAVQGLGKIPFRISQVDLASFSAHKLGGLKGTGAAYMGPSLRLAPLWGGGEQEKGLRTGTQNPMGAAAMALALQCAMKDDAAGIRLLRDRFESGLRAELSDRARINFRGDLRMGNTSSVTFPGLDGQSLILHLDMRNHQVSMGSACMSGSVEPSHVLLALGFSREEAKSTLRFSFGCYNTPDAIDCLLSDIVSAVRQMG